MDAECWCSEVLRQLRKTGSEGAQMTCCGRAFYIHGRTSDREILVLYSPFGDTARADPSHDHSRAIRTATDRLRLWANWQWRTGRIRWTLPASYALSSTFNHSTLVSVQRSIEHRTVKMASSCGDG